MDEELKTASMIQRRLLPAAPPGIDGYTFAGANRPCRTVSGDYYDFVRRPDGRMYFVIADVSGKGITAGLMMAGLQASFRIFCKAIRSPADAGAQLNDALKDTLPQSKFVTLFLGRLDLATGVDRVRERRPHAAALGSQGRRRGARPDRPRPRHRRRAPSSANSSCSSPPATRSSSSPTASPRPRTKTAKTSAASITSRNASRKCTARTRTTSPAAIESEVLAHMGDAPLRMT